MNILATTYTDTNALIGVSRTSDSLLGATRALLRRLTRQVPTPITGSDPVREAGAVRRMADSIRSSDPRFADDLYAAADRHERLHGGVSKLMDQGPAGAAPVAR